MIVSHWNDAPLSKRVQVLRWGLPLAIIALVVLYQLSFTTYIHDNVGDVAHTVVEISFYSVVGPVVTWLMLGLIGNWLADKEMAERKARAQEHHLASIVDASADAVISLDDQGLIRTWNRGAERIFGYQPQVIIGQAMASLLADPSISDSTASPLLTSQNLLQNYETVCLTQEGRRLSVEITRTPLRPTAEGASIILRDISYRKAREQLLEEERVRIARDLHDGLAQNLYFVGLKLDYVRKLYPQQPKEADAELAMLKQTVQNAIQEVRRSIFALRPVNVIDGDLTQAIETYIQDFGEQSGVEIEFFINGEACQMPGDLQLVLIQVLQESLTNVAKHANTDSIRIDMAYEKNVCRLMVRDRGQGFSPEAQALKGRHFGLRQMQERVENTGGRFSVQSVPGEGTLVQVEFPLRGWS